MRRTTRWALALLAAIPLIASPAFGQVVVETAPLGNFQALSIQGSPQTGEILTISLLAPPGSTSAIAFATRASSRPLSTGTLLVDDTAIFTICTITTPPSGRFDISGPISVLGLPGAEFAMQGAHVNAAGGLDLSNLCRVFVMGAAGPPVTALQLGPYPSATAATTVLMSGTAAQGGSSILIDGGVAPISVTAAANGAFSSLVALRPDRRNTLYFTETIPSGTVLAPVTAEISQDSTPPELFVDVPAPGTELILPTVTVAGRVADLLSGFMGLQVTVNGQPATVNIGIGTNGTFEFQNLPLLTAGTPTSISVVATDAVGNSTTRSFSVVQVAPLGPRMEFVSGNNQTGSVDQPLTEPLIVRVDRGDGQPFVDKLVTFTVTRSNGTLLATPGGAGSLSLQVRTGLDGRAQVAWRLGSDSGCGNNRVEVSSAGVAGVIPFCASASAAVADQVNISSGNNQKGATGGQLPFPFRVWVSDSCNPVGGVPVTFLVVRGGGGLIDASGATSSAVTVLSEPTGHAEVRMVLGSEQGTNEVLASIPGASGVTSFQAVGVSVQASSAGTFVGSVVDNAQRPLRGATCQLVVAGTSYGTVTTDSLGLFRFDQIINGGPADLYVDGLTVFEAGGSSVPQGSFPALHYEMVVLVGVENSLPTPVLLPPLDPVNVRSYSTTQETVLTVAGIDGLEMIVAPGSMTLANGSPAPNGTLMALNQVHSDKVPMPMPDGAAPPFAWTLQPAGARFSPPIRIRYPNMTGLAAGAIAYFLSFNHDTGRFEIVSSASVSADGSTVESDQGSGLSVAGWGCSCPPYSVTEECETDCSFSSTDPACCTPERIQKARDTLNSLVSVWSAMGWSMSAFHLSTFLAGGNVSSLNYPAGSSESNYTEATVEFYFNMYRPACTALHNAVTSAPATATSLPNFNVPVTGFRFVRADLNFAIGGIQPALSSIQVTGITIDRVNNTYSANILFDIGDRYDFNGVGSEDPVFAGRAQFLQRWQQVNAFNVHILISKSISNQSLGAFAPCLFLDGSSPDPVLPPAPDILTIGDQHVEITGPLGFNVANVTAADRFGAGGPGTLPDGLGDDFLRPFIKMQTDPPIYLISPKFQVVRGQTTVLSDWIASTSPPLAVATLRATIADPILTQVGATTQITTMATMSDGTLRDVTPRTAFTIYRSSNLAIAQVSADGLVTAIGSGIAVLTATNDGATSVVRVVVSPQDPLTTVEGFVRLEDSTPVSGATVEIPAFGISGTSGANGRFLLPGVPSLQGTFIVTARFTPASGTTLFGSSEEVVPVPGNSTDAGIIVLTEPACLFDTQLGTVIMNGDDQVFLHNFQQFAFPYFGQLRTNIWISTNGNLQFGGGGDITFNPSFPGGVVNGVPRISPAFFDLDARFGPGVFRKELADRLVVTWFMLPEFSTGGSNTIQAILYDSGRIDMIYNGVQHLGTAFRVLNVALSPGGTPVLNQVDFTNASPFSTGPNEAIAERFGQVVSNPFDLDFACVTWAPNAAGGYDVSFQTLPSTDAISLQGMVLNAEGLASPGVPLVLSTSTAGGQTLALVSGPDGSFQVSGVALPAVIRAVAVQPSGVLMDVVIRPHRGAGTFLTLRPVEVPTSK